MRKRRFDDGGDVREGRNENIGDDTRLRALEFLRTGKGSGESAPSTTPDAVKPRRRVKAAPDESAAETQRLREAAGRAEIRRLEREDKPLERVTPEEYMLPPGRLMRGLSNAARGMASRFGSRAAPELNVLRAAETPRLPGPSGGAALPAPSRPPMVPGPAGAAARVEGPGNMLRLEAPGSVARAEAARRARNRSERERSEEEESMQNEGGRYKKGGAVKKYAKGGAVSASRRGDGIAMRGKTKGRIY